MARKFKQHCNKITCEGCIEMHYNKKALRWCYDEKFGLATEQGERYSVKGKVYRVLTGVIEHMTYGSNSSEAGEIVWERNITQVMTNER